MTRLLLAVACVASGALPAAADPPDTCYTTANEQFWVCHSGVDRDCVYGYSSGTELATPTCATVTPQEHR